ncbi:hypothetical protein OH492_17150 [Vibrio chagasii]|nr:hypothetical protein [Vibrio chagasii]
MIDIFAFAYSSTNYRVTAEPTTSLIFPDLIYLAFSQRIVTLRFVEDEA